MTKRPTPSSERGFLLIEGLVAILIFSLGILGMIAMGSTAISAQSDAHYRTDAARLAEDIASTMSLNVVRDVNGVDITSLNRFSHMAGGAACPFSGTASVDPVVTSWVQDVETPGAGLPGLPASPADNGTREQIKISSGAGGHNQVEITVCWRTPGSPAGAVMRHHTLVTYIN